MMDRGKWTALGALLIAGTAFGFIAFGGLEENIVYLLNPQELVEKGASVEGSRVRLGGMVKEGSVDFNPDTLDLSFTVGMGTDAGAEIPVFANAAPPQMFREGIGVVVEGTFNGNRFDADRVLVQHNNEYQAPEEGEKPEQIYKTLLEGES